MRPLATSMLERSSNWDIITLLMSPLLTGPCYILQRAPKSTRKLAKSSFRGLVYALREMVDRATLLRDFYEPLDNLAPGAAGLEGSESLLIHLRTKKISTGRIQQTLELGEWGNIFRLPGMENPADASTKIRSDMAPLLRILESGRVTPRNLRPLKCVHSKEGNS